MAQQYLSPCRCFVARDRVNVAGVRTRQGDYAAGELAQRADTARITGDAVAHYQRHADHQPAIAFCVTVEHASHVAAAFRDAGYRAGAVHGGMKAAERDAMIAGLGTGCH